MKKKRGLKTQLLVTSLVLTCFLSSFSFVRAAYAFSPQYFSFTHGAASVGTYIEEANTTTATSFDIATVCSAEFDKYYSGTVTLKWTYNSSNYQQNITQWSIVVVGGKIDSVTSGTLVIRVYDQKGFQVIMHYYAGNLASIPSDDPGFNFTGASSSLTAVTNHNSEYDNLNSIDARLQTMNTNLIDLISAANNAQAYLGDISGYVDGVEGYLAKQYNGTYDSDVEQLLNNIKTDQQTGNTTLSSVNTRINNLQTYLSTVIGAWDINDPPLNILQAINSIADDMSSLETEVSTLSSYVNDIKTKVNSINDKLTLMQQDLESLLATVNNIDSLIDKISWIVDSSDNIGWSTAYNGDFNYSNGTRPFNTSTIIYLDTKIYGDYNSPIYHIKLPYTTSNRTKIYDYITIDGIATDNGGVVPINYYIQYSAMSVDIYLYDFYKFPYQLTSYPMFLRLTFTGPDNYKSYLYKYNNPSIVEHINSSDIEYWKLLSYFNELKQYSTVNSFDQQLYSRLGDIITAINNISINVNVTDQQIENITENFDQDINTIHNIENDYGLNFDGWDDQITSNDVNFNLTDYNSAISLIKANITSLWSSPLISLPILVSCLCFIFLVILG